MCKGALPGYLSMYHMYAWWPWKPEEGAGSPRTRVMDGYKFCVNAGNRTQVLWKNIKYS